MVPSDSGILPEYRGVTGTPPPRGGNHGPHGPWERRGANPQRGAHPPPKGSPIRKERGPDPPFPLPLLSFPISPSVGRKRWGGGLLLGLGVQVGLPPWRAPPGRRPPPPLLYIRGQGAPQRHINCSLSRVRCPPPQFTPPIIAS